MRYSAAVGGLARHGSKNLARTFPGLHYFPFASGIRSCGTLYVLMSSIPGVKEKNTSAAAGVFLGVQPAPGSSFVPPFRCVSSGRYDRCVALLIFSASGFDRRCAMKSVRSETNQAARLSGGNHGSIGDSWPIAFSGGARGDWGRVIDIDARRMQSLTNRLRLALAPKYRVTVHLK
jgi:hypothetical protein